MTTTYEGQFLLSVPAMPDPRFKNSIIAMCSHDDEGALGINIGEHHSELTFHQLLENLDIDSAKCPDQAIHLGGPVEIQRGFVIHSLDYQGEDVLSVGDKWGLSHSIEILRAIAGGHGPRNWICALGYAGWGTGQLESEMASPGWILSPADDRILYDVDTDQRWSAAYANAGIKPAHISSQSGLA